MQGGYPFINTIIMLNYAELYACSTIIKYINRLVADMGTQKAYNCVYYLPIHISCWLVKVEL